MRDRFICAVAVAGVLCLSGSTLAQSATQGEGQSSTSECRVSVEYCSLWKYVVEGGGGGGGGGGGTGGGGRGGLDPGGTPGGQPPSPPPPKPKGKLVCVETSTVVVSVPTCDDPDTTESQPVPTPNPPNETSMTEAADPTEPGGTTPTGTGPKNEFFGDPLNFIGEFARGESLLKLDGIGLDLDLRLINSSLWSNDGYLGSHWFLNVDWRLFESRSPSGAIEYLSLDASNGTRTVFVPSGPGLFESINGKFAKVKASGDNYILRYANGVEYHFGGLQSGTAWLAKIEDSHGNRISFQRHRSMLIDQITDTRGRVVDLTYYGVADLEAGDVQLENFGKLKSITDPAGRTWGFAYNDAGLLETLVRPASEVIDPSTNSIGQAAQVSAESMTTTYEYDASHRLTGVIESSDAPAYSLQNIYDAGSGRLIRQVNARGAVMEYKFEDLTGTSFDPLSTNVAEMAVLEKGFSGEAHLRVFNGFGQLLESKIYAEDISALDFGSGTVNGLVSSLTPLAERYYAYDSEGLLVDITAPEGNAIAVTYNTTSPDRFQRNQVLSATHNAGPRADGGVTGNDATDQTISFAYEPIYGGMVSATDPAGNTSTNTFDYQEATTLSADLQQLISDWQIDTQALPILGLGDVNGDTSTSGIAGNLLRHESPTAQVVDFTQAGSPTVQQSPTETYQYNDRGQLTHSVDAAGHATELVYDDDPTSESFGQAIQVIDALGNTMEYAFDVLGRMTRSTNERGSQTQIGYTTLGQINQVIRGESVDSTKAFGLLSLQNGETTKLFYDIAGNAVRSEQDQLTLSGIVPGVVTIQQFDAEDNVTSVEQQLSTAYGREIEYEYDLSNRLTLARSPEAVASQPGETDEHNHVRTYYDNLNRPCQVVTAEGSGDQSVQTVVYDSHGNVIARYDAQANAGGNSDGFSGCGGYPAVGEKWTYVYDGFDRLVRVDDPAGGYGIVHYDNRSNAIHAEAWGTVDGPGPVVKLASVNAVHDELNRTLRVSADYFDTAGNVITDDGNGDGVVQVRLLPDIRSLTRAVENDNGNVWQSVYDALARITTAIDPVGNQVDYAYDARGNLTRISQTDVPTGTAQQATLFEQALAYDVLDHLIQTVDTAGRSTYIYPDFKGRPLYTADANSQIPGTGIAGFTPIGQENAPGNIIARNYDWAGRLTRVDRHLTASGQGLGQLIPAIGSTQVISTATIYDDNDRVVQRLDGNGNPTDYRYDVLNRLTEIQYADGDLESTVYDADGNVIQSTQEDGTQLGYTYDALNRLTQLDTLIAGTGVTPVTQRMRYDGMSRVTWLEDSSTLGVLGPQITELQRSYSSLGSLLTEQTLSNGTEISNISARYSGAGQLLELVYPDGTQLNYSYDNAERLDEIKVNGVLAASYDYIGQRLDTRSVWTSTGQEIVSQASYDIGLNMMDWSHFVASNLQAGFSSTFDRTGRRTSETRSDLGTIGDVLTMDSAYRMTAFKASVSDAFAEVLNPGTGGTPLEDHSFDYDDAGNRTQVTTNGQSTVYQPNNMNEYAQYSYDQRGNLLFDGVQQYTYDALNRLIKIQLASGDDVHIARDATGRIRGEMQANGGAIVDHKLLHHAGQQRLQEDDQLTGSSVRLIHGGGLDELLQYDDANSYYPLSSPLGSAAQLLDNQGNLIERYEYRDGFGQPTFIDPTGTEQTDSAVGFNRLYSGARYRHGLYDLRHRQFDPQQGRFTQQDPLGAFADSPNLGNAYSYASNNPLNGLDPLGLMQSGPGVQNCGACHLNAPSQDLGYGTNAAGQIITMQDIMKQRAYGALPMNQLGSMERTPYTPTQLAGAAAVTGGAVALVIVIIPAGVGASTLAGAMTVGALGALAVDATIVTGTRMIVTDAPQTPYAAQAYGQFVYRITGDTELALWSTHSARVAQGAATLPLSVGAGGPITPMTLQTPEGYLVPAVAVEVVPAAAAAAPAAVAPVTEMFAKADDGDQNPNEYREPKGDEPRVYKEHPEDDYLTIEWPDGQEIGYSESPMKFTFHIGTRVSAAQLEAAMTAVSKTGRLQLDAGRTIVFHFSRSVSNHKHAIADDLLERVTRFATAQGRNDVQGGVTRFAIELSIFANWR